MFTTSCFLSYKSLSKDLIGCLEDLGWLNNNPLSISCGKIVCLHETGNYIFSSWGVPIIRSAVFVNCGTSEKLFISCAALRDDTDYFQWLIYPQKGKDPIWYRHQHRDSEISEMISEFTKLGLDKKEIPHKATISELIKKNMENLLNKLFKELDVVKSTIEDLCYYLLQKCEKHGIREIEVNTVLGTDKIIKVQITEKKYINNLADCFIFTNSKGEEHKLSDVKLDFFDFEILASLVNDKVFYLSTDPYEKFEDFDRRKVYYEGKTIVITDPCYVIEKDMQTSNVVFPKIENYNINELITGKVFPLSRILESYREKKRYQGDLTKDEEVEITYEDLGIKNYLENSTIYGDWSCTVYREENNEVLGEFCADSGMVGVFDLSEILQHNPDIKKWATEHPWCVTIIENFTGDVWMEIEEIRKEGSSWINHNVPVIGKEI